MTTSQKKVKKGYKCNKNVKNTVMLFNYRYCDDIIKT